MREQTRAQTDTMASHNILSFITFAVLVVKASSVYGQIGMTSSASSAATSSSSTNGCGCGSSGQLVIPAIIKPILQTDYQQPAAMPGFSGYPAAYPQPFMQPPFPVVVGGDDGDDDLQQLLFLMFAMNGLGGNGGSSASRGQCGGSCGGNCGGNCGNGGGNRCSNYGSNYGPYPYPYYGPAVDTSSSYDCGYYNQNYGYPPPPPQCGCSQGQQEICLTIKADCSGSNSGNSGSSGGSNGGSA